MRLWFCVCFLFCAYSISILIGEKNDVTYVFENEKQKYDLNLNYSLCVSLPELLSSALFNDRTPAEITIDDLKAKLSNSSELYKLRYPKNSKKN